MFAGEEMRTLKAVHDTIDYLRTEWMSNKMILRCRPAGYVLVYKVPPAPCIIIVIVVVSICYDRYDCSKIMIIMTTMIRTITDKI